ncbi:MAG: formate dehydrogenase subunit delta [Xanthobacteraceae bacterium]|jgi:formate dehydrogenase subunit delta
MSLDKLVYMANQIGKFFATQGPEQAAAGTADHIKKFWDPRMRATILAHLQAGGQGLDPVARAALERLTKANLEAAKQKTQLQ